MTADINSDLTALLTVLRHQLPPVDQWRQVRNYPDSLAECIIDALWSERTLYTTVLEIVDRYRSWRQNQGGDPDTDGAQELLDSFAIGLDQWMDVIGNKQRVYSRIEAPHKAQAVYDAAQACLDTGVTTTEALRQGFRDQSSEVAALKERWLALPGQHSGLTWIRLLLLTGLERVAPNDFLIDFVSRSVGHPVTEDLAFDLSGKAAAIMGTNEFRLRNAIWMHEYHIAQSGSHHAAHDHAPPSHDHAAPSLAGVASAA
jgi:hypothetical protein